MSFHRHSGVLKWCLCGKTTARRAGVNASGSVCSTQPLSCGRMLEVPTKASSWLSSGPSLWPGIIVQVHRCPDRCVMACNSVWERNGGCGGGRVETRQSLEPLNRAENVVRFSLGTLHMWTDSKLGCSLWGDLWRSSSVFKQIYFFTWIVLKVKCHFATHYNLTKFQV